MTEEHGGEDGLLADAANDKGKVTKASAAARLKALGRDAAAADEMRVLKELVAIMEKSAAASGKLSDAQDARAEKVAAKYPKLTEDEVLRRLAGGEQAATRLRAEGAVVEVVDRFLGTIVEPVDDFVVRRADGVAAYNLAVVIDDADQGVDQVVRGDDLVHTTPRQVLVQQLLGLPTPEYLHVPLVHGPDGERLAKRHGAITLRDQLRAGRTVSEVLGRLADQDGWNGEVEVRTMTNIRMAVPADNIESTLIC
jgi:glutamyl/glutaminyl-tRNA synthetase